MTIYTKRLHVRLLNWDRYKQISSNIQVNSEDYPHNEPDNWSKRIQYMFLNTVHVLVPAHSCHKKSNACKPLKVSNFIFLNWTFICNSVSSCTCSAIKSRVRTPPLLPYIPTYTTNPLSISKTFSYVTWPLPNTLWAITQYLNLGNILRPSLVLSPAHNPFCLFLGS